jgi:hypothetical protein
MCTAPICYLSSLAQWRGGRATEVGVISTRHRGKIFFSEEREKRSKHTSLAEAGLDPATVGYEPSTLSTAPLRCRYNIKLIRHQSDVDYNGPQPRSLDGSRRAHTSLPLSLSLPFAGPTKSCPVCTPHALLSLAQAQHPARRVMMFHRCLRFALQMRYVAALAWPL